MLDQLGSDFVVLALNCEAEDLTAHSITTRTVHVAVPSDALRDRYLGAQTQAVYLIRPDQHVVGRWASFDRSLIVDAIETSIGKG